MTERGDAAFMQLHLQEPTMKLKKYALHITVMYLEKDLGVITFIQKYTYRIKYWVTLIGD